MGDGCLLARSFVAVRSLNVYLLYGPCRKWRTFRTMSDRGRSLSTFQLGALTSVVYVAHVNLKAPPDSGNRCSLSLGDDAGVRAPRPLRRYFAPLATALTRDVTRPQTAVRHSAHFANALLPSLAPSPSLSPTQ